VPCPYHKHLAELKGKQEQKKNTNRSTIEMCKLKNWPELNQEMNLPIEIIKGTR